MNEILANTTSTDNQNIPVCPSYTNEDTPSNNDSIACPTTDSKLHSQVPAEAYVLKNLKVYDKIRSLID